MINPNECAARPEHSKNSQLRLIDAITWAVRSGLLLKFYTQRSAHQFFYCCTFESRIGIKVKKYDIKELSVNACLHHIERHYGDIFHELSCPPWPRANTIE